MAELFIEIGTEELPARFVGPMSEGLAAALAKLLGPLAPMTPRVWATPRRIAVAFDGVVAETEKVEKLVTGPPVSVAYRDGQPGPAAMAFAAKFGVSVEALERAPGPKGEVIAARRLEGGERLVDIVAAGLEAAILGIPFKKTMRWGARREQFPRPIRYVCAVLDGERVATTVAGDPTVSTSVGHWLWHPEPFAVTRSDAWVAELQARFVEPGIDARRERIARQLAVVAQQEGADVRIDAALLDEVTNLVEWPTSLVGEFDAGLLGLPERLLVESMKVNQRYFPLYRDGRLLNRFVIVSNNPRGDAALIATGNARVLAARFHDAKFFFSEDAKRPLAQHGARLGGMIWLREVKGPNGRPLTMSERQAAVAAAGERLAGVCGANPGATLEAGLLCKSDLPTLMVGEFPELQGHVGRKLAEAEGLGAEVALAIEEHYHPRFTGDEIPTTHSGTALALAERLTLLDAAFAAGLQPKGGADHLGLRRAANGVVALALGGLVAPVSAATLFEIADCAGGAEVCDFVLARMRASITEEGVPTDVVEAVFSAGGDTLVDRAARARAFGALAADGRMGAIRATFRRVAGLVKQNPGAALALDELDGASIEEAGRALRDAVSAIPATLDPDGQLAALVALRPQVDAYFDAVMVMADDPALRAARLGLLRAIVARFSSLADFSKLSTS
ncbi:glycine--tRNA ligase beta subunit [Deltaproteobacteria bacterium]|nr:glycine--tRNA ligase beta subunit [Deltaproteobacteria bacterium]